MLRSCRSVEKHDLTVEITVTSESMYTPRSRTEETGSTSVVPIRTDMVGIWC